MNKPGDVIDDRYEVLEVVGTGTFGTVFKAKQKHFDRFVAVKMLHHATTDPSDLARFEREAVALNSLAHKNIVNFYGYGVWQGAPYMVTEMVEGESLATVLRGAERLQPKRTIKIMRQVLSALATAHAHGMIHRDLKPSNILLMKDPDGTEVVKVIDFGLAKLLPGYGVPAQKLTETGFALGTVQYMSPEQCVGGTVDIRADLYAVGCMTYECLTGKLPFDALEIVEIMYQHLNVVPPPVTSVIGRDDVGGALQKFCENCLGKKTEQRYATPEDALRDLNAIELGQTGKLQTYGGFDIKQPAKRPKWVIPVAIVCIGTVGGIAYFGTRQDAPKVVPRQSAESSPESRGHVIVDSEMLKQLMPFLTVDDRLLFMQAGFTLLKNRIDQPYSYRINPDQRAQSAYIVAVVYRFQKKFSDSEHYARASAEERGGGDYTTRSRNLLIGDLIYQGKFDEAEVELRKVVKDNELNTFIMLGNVAMDMTLVGHPDRAVTMFENLLKDKLLKPHESMYCQYFLGDLCLSLGKVDEAKKWYNAGAAIKDEADFPNPCWIGQARLALSQGNTKVLHTNLQRLEDGGFMLVPARTFPIYGVYALMLADAAVRNDAAKVEESTKSIEALPNEGTPGLPEMFVFDDALLEKTLTASKLESIAERLKPKFTYYKQFVDGMHKQTPLPEIKQ